MIHTHYVSMELNARYSKNVIEVVQDDKYSRNICLSLKSNGENIRPSEQWGSAFIQYRKPDGTGGSYDTLPDGTAAYEINDTSVTIALAPQVISAPGRVELVVGLDDGNQIIHTFPIWLNVITNPGLQVSSEGYYNIRGSVADGGWPANKYLGTDANGNVVTKNAPEGTGGGSSEQLTGWAVTETDTTVTMVLETENGSHTHVLNFDANGNPTSITVDGVAIPGTWTVVEEASADDGS